MSTLDLDGLDTPTFQTWWDLYPRREARGGARGAEAKWDRLGHVERTAVLDGTVRWVDYWTREGTPRKMIPLPTTFLNQQRYNDPTPDEGPQPAPRGGGYEPTEQAMTMRQHHRFLTVDGDPLT